MQNHLDKTKAELQQEWDEIVPRALATMTVNDWLFLLENWTNPIIISEKKASIVLPVFEELKKRLAETSDPDEQMKLAREAYAVVRDM